MTIRQLSDGRADGQVLGQNATTDLLGFFGTLTPVVRPSISAVGTTTATTALNETRIARLTAALVSLNLIDTAG